MNVFNYTQLKLIFISLTYVKINQISASRNSDSLRKEFTPKVRRIKHLRALVNSACFAVTLTYATNESTL